MNEYQTTTLDQNKKTQQADLYNNKTPSQQVDRTSTLSLKGDMAKTKTKQKTVQLTPISADPTHKYTKQYTP